MPLVKHGSITADLFVHIADSAELPGDGAILVTAARFLEDPEGLLKRAGKVGVIWPNNRDLDDLIPYLDRLAAVALVFPIFRDGRAYSQARILRERYGWRRELRAIGFTTRWQAVRNVLVRGGYRLVPLGLRRAASRRVFVSVIGWPGSAFLSAAAPCAKATALHSTTTAAKVVFMVFDSLRDRFG